VTDLRNDLLHEIEKIFKKKVAISKESVDNCFNYASLYIENQNFKN